MEQVVQLNLTTPSLLFSAISLILLAYTNRFLAYASVIRNLNNEERTATDTQIANLLKRIKLVRAMQMLGVLSLLSSLMAMFFLYIRLEILGHIIFGIGMLLLGISLIVCVWEIWISTQAIKTHLYQIEKRSRPNSKNTDRQQTQNGEKTKAGQKVNGNGAANTNGNTRQQQEKTPSNSKAQQQTKGQDKFSPSGQQQLGKQQTTNKSQDKTSDKEPNHGKHQSDKPTQQPTRAQRSQERAESKGSSDLPKATALLATTSIEQEALSPSATKTPKSESRAITTKADDASAVETARPNSEEDASNSTNTTKQQGRNRNIRTPRQEDMGVAPSSREDKREMPLGKGKPEQRQERTPSHKHSAHVDDKKSIVAAEPTNTIDSSKSEISKPAPLSNHNTESIKASAQEEKHEASTTPNKVEVELQQTNRQERATRVRPTTQEEVTPSQKRLTPLDSQSTGSNATSEKALPAVEESKPITPLEQILEVRPAASTLSNVTEVPMRSAHPTPRSINPARARLPRIPRQPRPAGPVVPSGTSSDAVSEKSHNDQEPGKTE